jgi:ABC-type Fe3+/spermidine/putrescine transport system ATPase subunit
MLELLHISFSYADKKAVNAISFTVPKGQHLAIIGESGCGKSTLLKLIYGLYDLDEGEIFYGGKPVLGPKFNLIPGMDFMKYLAQDFDLMPFITVEENIGKYLSNMYKDKKKTRIHELLEMVEMTEYANVKAQYLSGGQQQRVALARVLALEPEVLLLDEPFSQIDVFRRNNLRRNLFGYLRQKNITCIFATHDSTDILAFADEVAVMKSGAIIGKNTPKQIYENPGTFEIASLLGEVNEIPKYLVADEKDKSKKLLVYPHQLQIVPKSGFQVQIAQSFFNGKDYLVQSIWAGDKLFFENDSFLEAGSTVSLALKNHRDATS